MKSILRALSGIKAWRVGALFVVLVATVGGSYGAYSLLTGSEGTGIGEGQQLIPVQRGDLINGISINGSLVYANREAIRFTRSGTVEELAVEEGQRVQEGQVLARLDEETIANLEKTVAQGRISVRNAEEALEDARNPYTPRQIAAAESDVATARISLANAEEALDALLGPTAQQLAQARLAEANARSSLSGAEDDLDGLTGPTDLDVANARSAVTNHKASLENAEDALDRLINPTDLDVVMAQSAVANCKASLKNAEDALTRLVSPSALDMASAEVAVANAQLSLDNAQDGVRCHHSCQRTNGPRADAARMGPECRGSRGCSGVASRGISRGLCQMARHRCQRWRGRATRRPAGLVGRRPGLAF